MHLLQRVRGAGAVFTAKWCEHCHRPMIDPASCEFGVCGWCALVCAHEYIRGIVLESVVDIRIGDFCKLCGRTSPEKSTLTRDEAHQELAMYGVEVIESPSSKAFAEETARRVIREPPHE